MMTDRATLECYYATLERCGMLDRRRFESHLSRVKDVSRSIDRIVEGREVDEVELFELKTVAIVTQSVGSLLRSVDNPPFVLPDLSGVIALLDPDATGVESFYLYDSYDDRLPQLRRALAKGDEQTVAQLDEVEQQVCRWLSEQLRPLGRVLREAFDSLIRLDICLARIEQMRRLSLSFARCSDDRTTSYRSLRNLEVEQLLESEGRRFEPIDITFGGEPTVIVGANMGGKSVTLRSIVAAQVAFQFGFGVAAQSASIDPKQGLVWIAKSEGRGLLSSFGVEVEAVDSMQRRVWQGERLLVAVDEPAASTNPDEGRALTTAMIETFRSDCSDLIVVTHYNIDCRCRRLRVRGVEADKMYYSLVEVTDADVPREALRVAEQLAGNSRWIERAKEILNNGE